ncbi:ISAs1 family transposase, partial [Chelonobacter oris]|uniref:ISAs1 family transposase n=1 Tax=Chelonobacter oris TaxID=505317 RepID=UPI0024491CFA
GTKTALHSITVWSKSRGLIPAQQKSPGWKNEQQGVLEILDSLILKNAVISVDAINTHKKKQETAFYISSLEVSAKQLAQSIRGHWEVENKADWVLDVIYKEDDCPINAEDGAENMA